MAPRAAPTRFRARSQGVADSVTVGVTVAVVCVPVWPGIFTIDSQAMLRAALEGRISNWYAPLSGWGWGLLDRLGVGPGQVFVLSVTAFVVAVLALAKQFLPDTPARWATVSTVLFPPVYGLLGWVGRDVWFATAVIGITALAWHVRRHGNAASLWAVAALILTAAAAADARQNGAPFALLAVGVAAQALRQRLLPQAGRVVRAGAVVCTLGLFWVLFLLAQRAVVSVKLHPEQYVFSRDLVAVSLEVGHPVLDTSLFPSQDLHALRARLAGRRL